MTIRRAPRRRPPMERSPAGEHFVEDRADRVDVGALVGRLAARFLRRIVVTKAPVGRLLIEASTRRQLERRNLRASLGRDHDRFGTQPAVHRSVCVGVGKRVRHLDRQLDSAAHVHWATRHLGPQRPTLQILEDDEDSTVVLARIEQRNDVGMRPGDERPRRLQQGRARRRVGREVGRQEAHGHGSPEACIPRAIQLTETCGLEPLEKCVVGNRADRVLDDGTHRFSSSMTLCSSSLTSPICSSTSAISSVGLPGVRALWQ